VRLQILGTHLGTGDTSHQLELPQLMNSCIPMLTMGCLLVLCFTTLDLYDAFSAVIPGSPLDSERLYLMFLDLADLIQAPQRPSLILVFDDLGRF
jgi:hypothetical protein